MQSPVHDVPGRLRFQLEDLRRNRRTAAMLRARVRAIAGVRSVSANPLTGSLIVHHDGSAQTRQNILASLAESRPGSAAAKPLPRSESKLAAMLASAIAERIIEHALRVAVAAVI